MNKNLSIVVAILIIIAAGIAYSLYTPDRQESRNLSPGQSQEKSSTSPLDDLTPPPASLKPAPSPSPSPQPQSAFRVISPNGGEKWAYGSQQTIRWSAPSSVSSVSILLLTWFPICDPASLPPGEVCAGFATPPPETYTIAVSTENDGAFEWTIPPNFSAFGFENASWNYVMKIQAGESFDQSDAPFSITASGS